MTPLAFRPAVADDLPLVVDSWIRSYRGSPWAGNIPDPQWYPVQSVIVPAHLSRPGCACWVAHHPGEEGTQADVYGWAAVDWGGFYRRVKRRRGGKLRSVLVLHRDPIVHYVYVKEHYRRQGIARRILAAAGVDVDRPFFHSHQTVASKAITRKWPGRWYDARLVRFPPPTQEQEDAEKEAGADAG